MDHKDNIYGLFDFIHQIDYYVVTWGKILK